MLLQVLRQTQALKDSLSFSSNQVAALTAELEQLRSELEQCRQKAVTDQEQVSK
jgi:regulator of replication initiation timing